MEELKASLDQVEEALIQKQEEVSIIKLVVGRMLTTHTFPLSLSLSLSLSHSQEEESLLQQRLVCQVLP